MTAPTNPGYAIPTRQKTELLFETSEALPTGTRILAIRRVAGYAAVNFFGSADAAFEIRVEEACGPDDPFVRTQTLTSSLVNGVNRICEQVLHCGEFMRVEISGAPLATLEVCGIGTPLA